MKTILVPTDFSVNAENSASYAAELAKESKAKLMLLNVFAMPVPVADVPVVMVPVEDVEAQSINQLKTFDKELKSKHPGIVTEVIARCGCVVDEVMVLVKERKTDLVVMGVTGAGRSMAVLGSNTSGIINGLKCPVLVIPEGLKYKKPEKIALACDYNSIVPEEITDELKDFVRLFHAELLVFSIYKDGELIKNEKAAREVHLENALCDIRHSLYYPEGSDVVKEINEFVEKKRADILVMLPHVHSFIEKILFPSRTKKMIFRTAIPLLSIHE